MNDLTAVLGLAFLGSIVALIGGLVFLAKKSWSKWLSIYSIPFAAGVLITVSLVGLLPEAIHISGESALRTVLFAFLGAYFFENFFFGLHHHDEGKGHSHVKSSIPLVIIGDTIHNFIDGVAIAATYLINPGLGIITTVSTFLHEVPHEIGDFGILLKAGWKNKSIILVNIFSASTTLLGAAFVYFFAQGTEIIGTLLAIASGLFLYLGASDFLPHIEDGKIGKNKAAISLLLGVVIMLATFSAVPHSHGEESTEHEHEHSLVEEEHEEEHEEDHEESEHTDEEDHEHEEGH